MSDHDAARPEARIASPAHGRLRGLRLHLLALILAVLVPALGISGAAAWHLARSYRQGFETRLQDTTRALALFVDSELDTLLTTVTALASSPLLEEDDLSSFSIWARRIGQAVDGWIVVNDAAPGHQQLLNTRLPTSAALPPPSAPGEGAWAVIRKVIETGRPAVSDLFLGHATGTPVLVAAAPALRDGRVARVVVLAMNPALLSERLRARRPSGSAYVSVADASSRIVARSQDHDRFVGSIPPSRGIPASERERGLFRSQTVYGDDGLFFAQKLLTAPGWSIVVAEPYSQYRMSWLAPIAALLLGAAAALALGLALAAWLARRVLHPVEALARRAEAVAEGRVRSALPPVPPAGVAEFELLRRASERAEAAVAAREAEFRAMFDTAAAGVAETDARTGRYLRVNQTFCAITGRAEDTLVGQLGPEDIAHPEDRDAQAPLEASGTESRILRPDGSVVWVQSSTALSARDAEGRPLRAVTILQDITARKQAEEARGLLAREVDHRAKNVLAVVQAVLRLTPKNDPATYARSVEARITALARAHTLLAAGNWAGADLRALTEAELSAFQPGAPEAPCAVLEGPTVILTPGATQALSLVLHELATNATKYGALSAPGGRVDLRWSVDEAAGRLHLRWAESGGPPVPGPPARRGFGTRVVEASLRDQLGATVLTTWDASGMVCEVDAPLSRAVLPDGTRAAA
jgi:PAS domain S-box-containing protein